MIDPIVTLIASYKEGALVQGAIRSALRCTNYVFVCEGPTEGIIIEGADETDLGPYKKYGIPRGEWPNERSKRQHMLNFARQRIKGEFWILTLDADEILVWGEYLPDWLAQMNPGYANGRPNGEEIIPIRRTEMQWLENGGFWTQVAPSRLIHSSIVCRYLVGCWMMETRDGLHFFADHFDAAHMPAYGEPHIHHRSYLRKPERKVLRLKDGEERRFIADPAGFMLREHGIENYNTPMARVTHDE